MAVFATVVGSFVLAMLLAFLVRRYGHFLYLTTKIPGPSIWDLVFVHAKELLSDNLAYHVMKLCKAYDHKPWGLWSMRGYLVFVSDHDSVEEVYNSKDLREKPTMFYAQTIFYVGKGLLSITDEQEYRNRRTAFEPAYRKSFWSSQLEQISYLAKGFTEKVEEIANGEDVDLRPMIHDYVATVSISIYCKNQGPLEPMLDCLKMVEPGLAEVMLEAINPVYFHLWHKFKRSYREQYKKILAVKYERDRLYNEEKPIALEKFRIRKEQPICASDVMMMHHLTRGDNSVINEEAVTEISTMLVTAHDTSKFILNASLALIALHPDVQKRIFDEIDSIFAGSLRPVQHEDLAQLEYIEMVLKETLRLFPPTPMIGRMAKEDVVIGGVTVPKGAHVFINILALHRNPNSFEDPLKFDPTRFTAEMSKGRSPYAYIPFSKGFRSCPGWAQAWVVLKMSLCHIFREFQVFPGTGTKGIEDIKPAMHISFHWTSFPLKFVKRNIKSD